jgi:hypothetical protein
MFDEPDENDRDRDAADAEKAANPADRAREKFDEFRMHAELAAVFEGKRKFDAQLRTKLDADVARDIQRTIGRLEKSKAADTPLLVDPAAVADAARLLNLPATNETLSTNDYHIHRRPGEVMVIRWLAGEQVARFYERFQAHFDAALNQYRQEERQSLGWKQDPQIIKYLDALDAIEVKMPDRYLRDPIRKHNLFILSTQAADEIDILYLADYLMSIDPAELVGPASAPSETPTERERAWFFKLFALRGVHEGEERMCFFAYLQKSDDSDW